MPNVSVAVAVNVALICYMKIVSSAKSRKISWVMINGIRFS